MDGVFRHRPLAGHFIASLVALAGISPGLALADAVNNEWNSTTRSQSMGNVGVASASDPTTAMFYNPAALARSKRLSFEFYNPQLEVGFGVFKNVKYASDHASLEKIKKRLNSARGTTSSLGASLYPNLQAQNFNFGILMAGRGSSYVNDKGLLLYRSRYVLMPTLGISVGALRGRFKLGFAVRAIQLTENDRSVAYTASTGVGYTVSAPEGFGIGLDAGAMLTMPWGGLPTLGVVARNVGDTSFKTAAPVGISSGTVTRHEKIKMTYDAGFAYSPRLAQKSVFTVSADYRDILNRADVSTLRRVNLGIEFDLSQIFFLRAGVSRGYWTAGVGLASKKGSLDLGSYAEELDPRGFRKVEDRRFSLRIGKKF